MTSIRKNLTNYLLKCNTLEIMAERARQKIAANPYFQSQTVFERFDKFRKGYLVPDDFSQFMLENQIYPTENQLYLIFRDFDRERVGVITLGGFIDELLPKENSRLREQASAKKYYQGGQRLEIDLEFLIGKYFQHKINEIKELSLIRLEMQGKKVYSVEEAFLLVDSRKNGTISNTNDIDAYLRSNGKVMKPDEISRIFRVLNFSRKGPILYETFSEHFDPLGKGFYIGYTQREVEKSRLHEQYLRQKLQASEQSLRNSRERLRLKEDLAYLEISNNRLKELAWDSEARFRAQQDRLWLISRGLD